MSGAAPYSRPHGSQPESPAVSRLSSELLRITGYQRFTLNAHGFEQLDLAHRLKYELIAPYLSSLDALDVVADIGCAAGAIGLQLAIRQGRRVAFIDHDQEYVAVVRACLEHVGRADCETHTASMATLPHAFPAGIAFALIHWIYSYSEAAGSLDRAVALIRRVATRDLFIEWVAPDDPAIRAWRHIEQNPESIVSPYRQDLFVDALRRHYGHCRCLGSVSATRAIWYASAQPVTPGWASMARARALVMTVRLGRLGQRVMNRLRRGDSPPPAGSRHNTAPD
jgi:hypothetical protein